MGSVAPAANTQHGRKAATRSPSVFRSVGLRNKINRRSNVARFVYGGDGHPTRWRTASIFVATDYHDVVSLLESAALADVESAIAEGTQNAICRDHLSVTANYTQAEISLSSFLGMDARKEVRRDTGWTFFDRKRRPSRPEILKWLRDLMAAQTV